MPILKGQEWTFDTNSADYDKFRPRYPEALYKTLFDYKPITESSKLVEVGIGAGNATPPILATGCELTAVELGENFTKLCREKFAAYPKFSVINNRFETTEMPENTYDMVYSASAFHWIPEEIGYTKVFAMLKSGGVFARWANHPYRDKYNPPLSEAIDRAYADYYYKFYNKEPQKLVEYTEAEAIERAEVALKYGFTDIKHAMFTRERTFNADEYIRLIGTYSDHIAMDEPIRKQFYAAIHDAINEHGGSITLYDTLDLEMARKP